MVAAGSSLNVFVLFFAPPPPDPTEEPDTYLCLLKLAHGFECSSLLPSAGEDSAYEGGGDVRRLA